MQNNVNYWLMTAMPRTDEAIAVQIIKDLNEFANVELRTRTRKRHILEPRQVACYMIRYNTELSLKQITNLLELDHSSVIHSVEMVKVLSSYDKAFGEKWNCWLKKRYRPQYEESKVGEE